MTPLEVKGAFKNGDEAALNVITTVIHTIFSMWQLTPSKIGSCCHIQNGLSTRVDQRLFDIQVDQDPITQGLSLGTRPGQRAMRTG